MLTLYVDPLRDALQQLQAGISQADAAPENELARDGVIQRFEYTHELSLRLLRRALETVFGDAVDGMPYNEVLRIGAERDLITGVDRWIQYRAARNKTSHSYDEAVAAEVYRSVRPFVNDAQFLLARLEALQNRSAT